VVGAPVHADLPSALCQRTSGGQSGEAAFDDFSAPARHESDEYRAARIP